MSLLMRAITNVLFGPESEYYTPIADNSKFSETRNNHSELNRPLSVRHSNLTSERFRPRANLHGFFSTIEYGLHIPVVESYDWENMLEGGMKI